MKIGVIGLGKIAQKAYLPLYASRQDYLEVILASRDEKKAEKLKEQYGFSDTAGNLDELIDKKVEAVFIHSATSTHYAYCKKLLEAGIPTYVDKPVSENIEETREIFALAEKLNVPFFVGFNRRYAPFVQQLKEISGQQMIIQKNRENTAGSKQFHLYDLFIHVVDTAVYLLNDQAIAPVFSALENNEAGVFTKAQLVIKNKEQQAIVLMNLASGANLETFEVQGQEATYRLENLTSLTKFTDRKEQFVPGDWENTLVSRGFSGAMEDFLQQVTLFNEGNFDFEKDSQKKALLSHELVAGLLAGK
ncbi:Gfo/Idh/MocA family protein [Enterococcus timonensis]|uniref:Gfo/Idh/MocA family protein n=1 Tax=Enterococcus timonensis TaxID=1852364 RepID=UPI0008D9C731|nr:Gfo/Idh/MocA family oxidoreductase [Enterococcus timonensis]